MPSSDAPTTSEHACDACGRRADAIVWNLWELPAWRSCRDGRCIVIVCSLFEDEPTVTFAEDGYDYLRAARIVGLDP